MSILATACGLVAAGGAIWFTVMSVMMCDYVQKHGRKVNYLLLRLYLPKYINDYKELTTDANGEPGVLYGRALTGIKLAAIFAALAIVLKLAG